MFLAARTTLELREGCVALSRQALDFGWHRFKALCMLRPRLRLRNAGDEGAPNMATPLKRITLSRLVLSATTPAAQRPRSVKGRTGACGAAGSCMPALAAATSPAVSGQGMQRCKQRGIMTG